MRSLLILSLLLPGAALAQGAPPADAAFCLRVVQHGMACRAQHGDPLTGNTVAFGACMTRALGVQDALRAVALLDRARGSWAGALMECARR
ncbi:hypothetical protein [Muricoccus radiodurans]|uniref:hypothetical protein n=1 Tax=Muricoccus radiodurans TaxID=2231721 RepID=UPI003CF49E9D